MSRSRSRWPDVKPLHNTPLARAASEGGGVLIYTPRLYINDPPAENGGCGQLTHVSGTQGGMMHCGSVLTMFGRTLPYYCARCRPVEDINRWTT